MTLPPFSSLIIVELHFQNSRHRQSHVNLFYCLQGVLNLILHCYCDIVMKNLFFFVTTIVIIMDLPTLRDFLQLPSWYILYDEDELCLMSVREEADFHYHNAFKIISLDCSAMCCGWLFCFKEEFHSIPVCPTLSLPRFDYRPSLTCTLYSKYSLCKQNGRLPYSKVEN